MSGIWFSILLYLAANTAWASRTGAPKSGGPGRPGLQSLFWLLPPSLYSFSPLPLGRAPQKNLVLPDKITLKAL